MFTLKVDEINKRLLVPTILNAAVTAEQRCTDITHCAGVDSVITIIETVFFAVNACNIGTRDQEPVVGGKSPTLKFEHVTEFEEMWIKLMWFSYKKVK